MTVRTMSLRSISPNKQKPHRYKRGKRPQPLDGFRTFLKDVKSVWSLTFSGPVILPFVAAFAGIAPPWPKHIESVTAAVALIALILAYTTRIRANSARLMVWLAFAVVTSLLLYLAWFNLFTYKLPTNGEVVILGCGLTYEAILVANEIGIKMGWGCPGNFQAVLSTAQYDSWVIWSNFLL